MSTDRGSAVRNAELARELLEAVGERRLSVWAEHLDRDIELDTRDLPQPDISGVYRGLDEFARWTRSWLSAWEHLQNELLWVDANDERAIAWIRMRMSGKGSSVPVEQAGGWGFTFREERIVHARTFIHERTARRYLEEGRTLPAAGHS
jgi:ketosteroid isomerase-like protein